MRRSVAIPAILTLCALAACANKDPGGPGEACNFESDTGYSCTSGSVCLNDVCHVMCSQASSASPDCGGGACLLYTTVLGNQYTACEDPTGEGSGPGSGGGSGAGGFCSASTQQNCQSYTNQCASCGECQAPCYCAAACDCKCAGDSSCEQQNLASAASLGTTCSY